MRIVFFGTSSFSAAILSALQKLNYDIVGIVTRPDRPQGRKLFLKSSAVKEYGLEFLPHVPIFQPEKASTEEFAEKLRDLTPDLFLVVAYGEILKQNILSIPEKACVNIHTSLLPKYRGASPIQAAILHGDSVTGVTFMEMALKMDAGDVLKQERVSIPLDMNVKELEEALCQTAMQALPEFLQNFDAYYLQKKPQDDSLATFVSKISPVDCIPDWNRSAEEIHNQIRALSPYPGVFIQIRVGDEVKRLKILASNVEEVKIETMQFPGSLYIDKSSVKITCQKGVLSLLQVQLEGKKSLKIEEFLRGMSKHFSLQNK